MAHEFWYWPTAPGRGEFVRLFMEAAGIEYRDMTRELGAEALVEDMERRTGFAPFAPPYLVDGDLVIAQTAHILAYLTDRHGLGSGDLPTDLQMIQLQLTVTDFVAEAHDVHHPLASSKYYEEQKDAALVRAEDFRENRMPKYLGHFERASDVRDGPFLAGERFSHADTSLFVLIEGLTYAFPKRLASLMPGYPGLVALHEAVGAIEGVKAYRASSRCMPFNESGIFRNYPELDAS